MSAALRSVAWAQFAMLLVAAAASASAPSAEVVWREMVGTPGGAEGVSKRVFESVLVEELSQPCLDAEYFSNPTPEIRSAAGELCTLDFARLDGVPVELHARVTLTGESPINRLTILVEVRLDKGWFPAAEVIDARAATPGRFVFELPDTSSVGSVDWNGVRYILDGDPLVGLREWLKQTAGVAEDFDPVLYSFPPARRKESVGAPDGPSGGVLGIARYELRIRFARRAELP